MHTCVCMCICMCTHALVCVVRAHTFMCIGAHVCACTYIHVYWCARVHIHSCVLVRTCVCALSKLRLFIEESDQNLKYLGLLAMAKILKAQPKIVEVGMCKIVVLYTMLYFIPCYQFTLSVLLKN